MQLRTAIVEDVEADAIRLEVVLKALSGPEDEISSARYGRGDELLVRFKPGMYQLVFLDICMEGTNGIETARQLRQMDSKVLIVFVTSSAEYVWDSFSIHPFEYLLKPYDDARVAKVLQDAAKALDQTEPELEVRVARQTIMLPFGKIDYALAQNHFVCIMTDDGEQRATGVFSQIQERLCTDPRFLVCNRGVIINMDKVLRFENDQIQMRDGSGFPVRQKDKGRLFAEFTQYQFRHMRRKT